MKKLWWHDKIAYQIYPKSFYDSNGDGIGDLQGIIQKLDYLKDLGIDILWISPIYPSPMKDNGYDISDYYGIDPRFGTMEDMEKLLAETKKRNMYVLMDLVINHCSDKHEWFQKALADPDGPYADYFYFKKGINGNPPNNWRSYFGGSVWEPVPGTDKYYLHMFHKGQPDLNWENETLRKELYKMVNWWLEKGIAGYRIDAIINIKKDLSFQSYAPDGPDGLSAPHVMLAHAHGADDFLEELKLETFRKHHAFTIGEVFDITEADLKNYIGENGHFDCQFDFDHLCLGESEKGWYAHQKPEFNQWRDTIFHSQEKSEPIGFLSNIIENHDRPRGAETFLPKEAYSSKSVSTLGASILFLRGLPFLYQGQEIGMCNCPVQSVEQYDDISTLDQYHVAKVAGLSDAEALASVYPYSRDNSRTMMQWSDEPNAGFTTGKPWFLVNPNYKEINVAKQQKEPDSILHHYKEMIALRKNPKYKELFTYGSTKPMYQEQPFIFSYKRILNNQCVLIICNFSNAEVSLTVEHSCEHILWNNYETINCNNNKLTLAPYQTIVMTDCL